MLELDDIVKICDGIISYDSTVIISAISEIVLAKFGDNHDILLLFKELSARLKYGLGKKSEITFYEVGFSDREVTKSLTRYFDDIAIITSKLEAKKYLKKQRSDVENILNQYPSVFLQILKSLR